MSKTFLCPCGLNNNKYNDCCGLVHTDINNAISAEQLMRSRYSAFVLCDSDYLLKSHSVNYRNPLTIHNTIRWARSVAWNRLEIISKSAGTENDLEGIVEFKAYFREKNKLKYIHEVSRFIRENEHWVYVESI
jgi:SEC-C motif-containing protein